MICERIELAMETTQPRDVAKAMLCFWQHQYEQAQQSLVATEAKIKHMKLANKEVVDKWRKDDSLDFRGPLVPYSTLEINSVERQLPTLRKHYEESKATYGYMINFITDKAHP